MTIEDKGPIIEASTMAVGLEVLKADKLLNALESFKAGFVSLAKRFLSHVDTEHRPDPTCCAGYGPCLSGREQPRETATQ